MKKRMLRFLSIFLSCSLIISLLAGCTTENRASFVKTGVFDELKYQESSFTEGITTENDRFIMSWNDTYKQVVITDKQGGGVYSTMPTDAMEVKYDADGFEVLNNIQIESPIIVYYYDPETLSENQAYGSIDAITDGEIFTERIDNGIRITYVFSMQEIAVPVDYILKESSFQISVDTKSICDNGEYFVTGVAIAPFLCSLSNDSEDSYLFLPDGSGAVVKPETIDHIGRQGSKRVYGDDITVNEFTLTSYNEKINMPIFGKKQGENGILGIITSSAERAYISWDIGSNAKKYSSVYPFFRIRGYDIVKRPSGFMMSLSEIPVFDDYIIEEPLTVEYYPLSKENASYSGMAKIYREYLLTNNLIERKEEKEIKAAFRILGGLEQKTFNFGIPSTELSSLTTIAQAREIAEYLNQNIDGELMLSLVGFGESGLDIGEVGGGFKIASKFGSKKEIKSLASYCDKSKIKLFMDFDIVGFGESGNGFSASSDTAKSFDGQTVYLDFYSNVTRNDSGGGSYMLLSRNKLTEATEKAVKTVEKYGFSGVSLSSLSNTAYSDYSLKGCGVSGNLANDVAELYSAAGKKTQVVSSNANVYAAGISDYITEAPTASSQYDITLYDVPFYQMVFKGYVPMSSTSVNLVTDTKTAVLKCIEAGIAPSFTLSYDYNNSFAQAKFSAIPISSYKGLKEEIINIVSDTSVVTDKVFGAVIVEHTVADTGLRITEFNNGVKIAVNYSDEPITYGDIRVEANDYIMWEG